MKNNTKSACQHPDRGESIAISMTIMTVVANDYHKPKEKDFNNYWQTVLVALNWFYIIRRMFMEIVWDFKEVLPFRVCFENHLISICFVCVYE